MKKNVMMRLASVLLVAILLSTCALSATFAKYTSTGTGSATATVAKWAFDFNAADEAVSTDVAFGLFNAIKDSDGNAENDVAAGKIAPGTSGSVTIQLKNASEVNATYSIAFAITGNLPLEFCVGEITNETQWTSNIAEIAGQAIGKGDTSNVVINWRWPFTETVENSYSEANVTVTATVTASQVD